MTFAASRSPRRQGRGRPWLLALLALALASASGHADQPDPRIGIEVVMKYWDTPLRVGTQVSEGRLPHRVFRVERTQGEWLWIVAPNFHGWVKEEELISLDRALGYFDAEVLAHPDDPGNYLRRAHLLARKGDLAKRKPTSRTRSDSPPGTRSVFTTVGSSGTTRGRSTAPSPTATSRSGSTRPMPTPTTSGPGSTSP